MAEMMTFPDTWEEFEKSYGFTDNEEIYTNGARLIPSFRVKQWLDHLPSVQPELSNNSKELENKNGELISRQAAIQIASGYCHPANIAKELKKLPFVQTTRRIWCEKCYWSDKKGCSIYCRAWNRYTAHDGYCHQYADRRGDSE